MGLAIMLAHRSQLTALLLANGTADDLLRLLDYGGKVLSALQALGVEFIDLFRA